MSEVRTYRDECCRQQGDRVMVEHLIPESRPKKVCGPTKRMTIEETFTVDEERIENF